ncbi:MAG: YfhO family protein, partial [Candidatus Goldiibacteriota bacterium]
AFISWSLHPLESLTLLFPHLFGFTAQTYYGAMNFNMTTYYFGSMAVILALAAFFRKKTRGTAVFTACAAALFLILSWGGFTPLYGIFFHIPVFKQFRTPSRFMYIFTFFMCVLSAIGLENIMAAAEEQKEKKTWDYFKWAAIALGSVCALLLAAAGAGTPQLISSLYGFFKGTVAPAQIISFVEPEIITDIIFFVAAAVILAAIIFLLLKKKIKNLAAAAFVLAAFNLIDMHRIDSKFINFVDYNTVIPSVDPMASVIKKDSDIVRSTDFSFDWGAPNRNIYYDLEGVNGMHGLMPGKYVKMRNDGAFNFLNNDRYFNIKYYITKQELVVKGLTKIYDDGRKVFMDASCAPRFDFTDTIIKMPGDAEIYNLMKSGGFDYKSALVKDDIVLTPSGEKLAYKIGLFMYSPNRIKMRVTTTKDGLLIVKNQYYPAWKVEVDKRPGKIYNVDYCFMGIPVKAGTHVLDIYYGMGGFYAGLMLTLAGLGAYIIVFIFERRKKEKSQDK